MAAPEFFTTGLLRKLTNRLCESTVSGALWQPLGGVSPANARLLAATAGTRVRFVPNGAFDGAVAQADADAVPFSQS